uniref:FHOD1/3-like FH3 domain-containing protein n=1 Tax=Salmo trutta TaxID=8032 RepID=A0A674CR89_SALTR
MLYVDGMNGVICHIETVQWLYTLIGPKFRPVVKTALKLLLVFVDYSESNAPLLIEAITTVDTKRGCKQWSNAMEMLDEKDGLDTELLVYVITLINKVQHNRRLGLVLRCTVPSESIHTTWLFPHFVKIQPNSKMYKSFFPPSSTYTQYPIMRKQILFPNIYFLNYGNITFT